MLAKRVIPCLDVADGRVVKGENFVNLRDAGDPVECAKYYSDEGADEIVVLDINASHENRATLLGLVEKIATGVHIPLTVGGGISSIEDIDALFAHGADKISINSALLKNLNLATIASAKYGSQAIVAAIDSKSIEGKNFVFTHGGRRKTEHLTEDWVQEVVQAGAGEILLTSMDRDGTSIGYDLPLCSKISNLVEVPVIASGGVGSLQDFADGIEKAGADAVLAAGVFHFGKFSILEVKDFLAKSGICVRTLSNHQ